MKQAFITYKPKQACAQDLLSQCLNNFSPGAWVLREREMKKMSNFFRGAGERRGGREE